MSKSKIPDRWEPYVPMGSQIPGTSFMALKVPLKRSLCRGMPEKRWFTPDMFITRTPQLGLVIDLTNTTRYYDRQEFTERGIYYEKIFCEGHVIPSSQVVNRFFQVVDSFTTDPRCEGYLIGVHCTHGVNRTGYLICRYMIQRLGISPEEAINRFNAARGHRIERDLYLNHLKSGTFDMEPEQPPQDAQQFKHTQKVLQPGPKENHMGFYNNSYPAAGESWGYNQGYGYNYGSRNRGGNASHARDRGHFQPFQRNAFQNMGHFGSADRGRYGNRYNAGAGNRYNAGASTSYGRRNSANTYHRGGGYNAFRNNSGLLGRIDKGHKVNSHKRFHYDVSST